MKDTIGQIYNGFLLRDVLGYVLPGSFVLICMIHLVAVISGIPLADLLAKVPDKWFLYFLAIALSYACGHFLSGIFFHTFQFNRFFSYTPRDLLTEYPKTDWKDAWARHRSEYRQACSDVGAALQDQVERHAALLHFTGHFAAALFFAFLYIIIMAIYTQDAQLALYVIPLVIIFPGIYRHFKTLSTLRYKQEKEVIRIYAELLKKGVINPAGQLAAE